MSIRERVTVIVLVAVRLALRGLSFVIPRSHSVVVSGYPETEGNAVEVARALLSRYDGRVVWLRDAGPVPDEIQTLESRGLVLVPKASVQGLVAYLRSRAVFFTHGLYGSPSPVARRPVVNLWHGDGPKDVSPENGVGGMISSTYFVGSTTMFSRHQATGFHVPPENLLITGNPRTDRFFRSVEEHRLRALGVTGDFVVWMPTFRRTRSVGAMRAQSELSETTDDSAYLAALADGLRARGLQLVIKAHPMDAEDRTRDGALTISDSDLVEAGLSLYALLGSASGLVTDYSSVWVDFLLTDRPMAFLVPDRTSYTRRLIPPDVLEWVPGELVASDTAFTEFFADLDSGGRRGAAERAQVAARIGLNPTRSSAEDLLSELRDRGVLALS